LPLTFDKISHQVIVMLFTVLGHGRKNEIPILDLISRTKEDGISIEQFCLKLSNPLYTLIHAAQSGLIQCLRCRVQSFVEKCKSSLYPLNFTSDISRAEHARELLRQDIVKGYANVSLWSLGYSKSREFPEILLQGESKPTKVFALHLPSKKKALFSARLQSRYFIRFSLDSKKGSRNTFYKWAFITAVFNAIARRLGRYF
jgi:hypothetical protein